MKLEPMQITTAIFAFLIVWALITVFSPKSGLYIGLATLIGILGYQLTNKVGLFAVIKV